MEDNPSAPKRSVMIHLALFVVTCITTFWAGYQSFGSWQGGVGFGGTLMAILVCHEMGHYLVARRHGIEASLPYFVPLPPQFSLGTLGAVIRMDKPIADRNQLIDVGAAGPIAGLVVAIPFLCVGLWLSPLGTVEPGANMEGNSLLYLAVKYAVFGEVLPTADGRDVMLSPMAFAAWVGLLITMINLIPIGQLDGGHLACGYLGEKHERSSRWLHRLLVLIAVAVVLGLFLEARGAGRDHGDAWTYGLLGGLPWVSWAGILYLMRRMSGGIYHPPVGHAPLSPGRRRLVWAMLVVFAITLTPVPLRSAL